MKMRLLLVAAVFAYDAMGQRVLQRYDLRAYANATCNDGTPAVYYFQPATSPALEHIYVLQQEGGGWCWSQTSCTERQMTSPSLMTSLGAPTSYTAPGGSILDATGTRFAGANVAYLRYCTSDGYIGNSGASRATGGLSFRGRRVVEATIAALAGRHGLGRKSNASSASAAPATLLYSGCSAGGRGVMHNLNYVAKQVSQLAGRNARVFGLIDSGLYIDLTPLPNATSGGANVTALRDQAKGIVSYAGAAVDPICASMFPGDERYRCLLGEYAIGNGTLQAPHLVHAFQFDAYQLCVDLRLPQWECWSLTKDEIGAHGRTWSDYISTFRARTRGVLLGGGGAPHGLAVHSAACYKHCNTQSAGFSLGYKVQGVSLAAAFDHFAFGEPASTSPPLSESSVLLVENCTGFSCGDDCRAVEPNEQFDAP